LRGVGVDQALRHFARMRGRVADALDAWHFGDVFDQQREVGLFFRAFHVAAVGIDVLAEQGDFTDAIGRQVSDFGQHIVERARNFAATGIGHDAEGAELRAAFHDRDESRSALDLRRRHRIELLDFREGNIDRCLALRFPVSNQLRQAVQRLRAEHHINIRCAGNDRFAFLAGDAATDADHQVRIQLLQVADAPEVVENLLLCLLAHRAGVEQDDVGFFRIVGLDYPFGGIEHVGHLVRIVLIHLAPESADEQFFWHG
jgi:hypothetical protein